MENPSDVKGKNHRHQPATISLSQEFWVTRLWRLTRESSLHETLARVYIRSGPSLRRRVSAPLRQKPGLYLGVNLEQLQQKFGFKSTSKGREEKFNTKMVMPNCIVVLGDRRGVGPRTWRAVQGCTLRPGGPRRAPEGVFLRRRWGSAAACRRIVLGSVTVQTQPVHQDS